MNNLARVALLAIGAMAAKKYIDRSRPRVITDPYGGNAPAQSDAEIVDAEGRTIEPRRGMGSSLRSVAANPNWAWMADPELRAKNMQRLREVWAHRHER